MHHDHAGGLDHFPHTRIIVTQENYDASRGFFGRVAGCLPQHWPIWLKPELIELTGPAVGPFASSYPITRDGRIGLYQPQATSRGMFPSWFVTMICRSLLLGMRRTLRIFYVQGR